MLLQVLDDGRLTDGHGRTVDFRNTIIVMTSNLGSQAILRDDRRTGWPTSRSRRTCARSSRSDCGRSSSTASTRRSSSTSSRKEDLGRIVEIQLRGLRTRLADRGLSLEVTDAATAALVDEGYDPQFGARPLKRVIQQRIENPLATRILSGEFVPGDCIEVDATGHTFTFRKADAADVLKTP